MGLVLRGDKIIVELPSTEKENNFGKRKMRDLYYTGQFLFAN